ncbi:hypothetical protein K438DRAFT_1770391 [Mycena galopus ATCC 62051]|nr:hypothetical protein K438DRAFT_1770391 [Mycena galopus ATCC 62051]
MAPRTPSRSVISVEDTEQYQYVLTNFRIAHEKVEEQRMQLEEQEQQVAQLRARIELLEGGPGLQMPGGSSVDDFSVKKEALQLDKLINRFASDIIRQPPTPIEVICEALLSDIGAEAASTFTGTPMQVQCLLRHAISEVISEGFINCLIVSNSKEANIQLTRIHEHIFARKRPNRRSRLAPPNLLRRRRHLHARDGAQHPHRADPAPHTAAAPRRRTALLRARRRVPLLAHAARHQRRGRRVLPRVRAGAREHAAPAADRARQEVHEERARGGRSGGVHDVPGAGQSWLR